MMKACRNMRIEMDIAIVNLKKAASKLKKSGNGRRKIVRFDDDETKEIPRIRIINRGIFNEHHSVQG